MTEALSYVKSGQVTYAVRDTSFEGHEIHESDIMGISDHGIVAVGQDIDDTTLAMIETMMDDDAGLLSIYYGSDVTEEQAQGIVDRNQPQHGPDGGSMGPERDAGQAGKGTDHLHKAIGEEGAGGCRKAA